MIYFMKDNRKIIVKCRLGGGGRGERGTGEGGRLLTLPSRQVDGGALMEVQGAKAKSGGQINSWKRKEPSKLIYFEYKFDINTF